MVEKGKLIDKVGDIKPIDTKYEEDKVLTDEDLEEEDQYPNAKGRRSRLEQEHNEHILLLYQMPEDGQPDSWQFLPSAQRSYSMSKLS